MKKIWIICVLAAGVIFAPSCANEVDLTAEWQDIPVVYGLLSRAETDHYVRIQKAYLDPDGNALEIAKISDSLYYNNIDVVLERENTGETYPFERVDGNVEGYVREEGIFSNDPNYLYKLNLPEGTPLVGGENYKLRINRGDSSPEVTATARIVSDYNFIVPSMAGVAINMDYSNFSVTWRPKPDAAFFDFKVVLHYKENSLENPTTFEDRTLTWNAAEYLENEGGPQFRYQFLGEDWYRFVGSEIEEIEGVRRVFISLDFVVEAGGQSFFDYINIGRANTGITSSQVIPTFTNLSEGLGIFSSRNRLSHEGFTFKPEATDSLEMGVYTKNLNFQ